MSDFKKLSIKDWAEEDRPREKLMLKGTASLSDAELIAILLSSGNREETAVELAKRMLADSNNNLNEMGKRTIADFMEYKGIGDAKSVTIVAALELGKRRKLVESVEKMQIKTSKDTYEIFHAILADLPHEEFWILILNQANKLIEKVRIGQGGTTKTIVDIKIIVKAVLDRYANKIIICHNHPSGNCAPSQQDKDITKQIKMACQLFDIQLLDHIILCDGSYFSFADEEIL